MESGTEKKRSPRKNTTRFLIVGPAPGFVNGVREYTSAMSEKQAFVQVLKRLEKKYRIRIYLGDCRAIKQKPKP